MFTDFQINKATLLAVQQVIAKHTVVILTNGRSQVGTGTLLAVGPNNVILTAYHNVDGVPALDLLFGFKHEGNVKEVATAMSCRQRRSRTLFIL